MQEVQFFDSLPSFFFDINQKNVLEHLQGMSLIFHAGNYENTVLVSTMLHGNETSGLDILKKFLKKIEGIEDRPNILILLGNPKAFHENKRFIQGQLDHNRIWTTKESRPDNLTAQKAINHFIEHDFLCAVDIHNNTGKNPIFCCVNRLDKKTLGLAQMFGTDVLFFEDPETALSTFMGRFCPSMAIECGLSGDEFGIERATKFLTEVVKIRTKEDLIEHKFKKNIFKSFGKFTLPIDTEVSFIRRDFLPTEKNKGVYFFDDLEGYNLKLVPEGTHFGFLFGEKSQVESFTDFGEDIFSKYFEIKDNKIISKISFYAAMVTKDVAVAKADCFFYFLNKV